MLVDALSVRVAEIASPQAGYPFRGAIEEMPSGDVLVVQMKDVDPDTGIDWSHTIRTSLGGRKHPDWLRTGDVLFVAKGARFYAVCVGELPARAVCAPAFFHLRVKASASVVPAFLAWQINQPPFQRQLQQAAEGSGQLSIRRPVLESLILNIPVMRQQLGIVALAELARSERQALHHLIRNRNLQLHALAEGLGRATQQNTQQETP